MARRITASTSLDNLKKEAKRWLRAVRAGDADARARLERAYPTAPAEPGLRDVQHALAREHGFDGWIALMRAASRTADDVRSDSPDAWSRVVDDILLAFNARDEAALQRLNARYRMAFTFDDLAALVWGRVYAYRQRAFSGAERRLFPDEARMMAAQTAGYPSWDALIGTSGSRPARVPAYVVEADGGRIGPRRFMSDTEWDEMIDVAAQRRIPVLDVGGLVTDERLARIARFDHVTTLRLTGARWLTDDGLRHLTRMPQLEHLDLTGCARVTDHGLEVLMALRALRSFKMVWHRGISDAGLVHLRACERLEQVDLMGSTVGDGVIAALAGKPALRELKTGVLVSDAGLARLREIPRLSEPPSPSANERGGAVLLLDGPFTNTGFAHIAQLQGVVDLDLFWQVTGITSNAYAHLARLPHLAALGADGRLSDDEAMRHFGAMPGLRRLRAQESVATDDGFEALGRSTTLEGFWGRECEHFGSRGFVAFSRIPTLRALGVGCAKVSDEALARLPEFPSLRELTPIGFQDAGFRHIGACHGLQRLTCMYCRDTTDAATAHVSGLSLQYYYAGLTRITDRSLEMLGRMPSLEQVELYECRGVTDAGLPFLAALPRLRRVALDGLPNVTLAGTRVFPPHVRVSYSQ